MFKYWVYKIGLYLLHRLPLKFFYSFALFVSDLHYMCSFRDRRAVRRNLKKILPSSANLSFETKEVFRNFGRYLIEFFQMAETVDARFIKEQVRIRNIHHLDDALVRGKGGIVVTAHIGNWELGAVILSVLGYPLLAVALPHKERPVNDLFNQQREVKGVEVIPSTGALRGCIQQLRDNKFVALVADRDFTNHGVVTDFMGRKMLVPKGAAMFSWKTGAPIIPVFLIRNSDGTFDLTCYDAIEPPEKSETADENEVILGIMRRYLSVIEEVIHRHPSQWLLFREFSVQ